ncbi:MAG TPA: addiction module protein [Candidatus Methylomirabilis sp.]|nr:addiction module protein [Candidatus Methylomirabilis sp.]
MELALPLDQMTTAEKLRALEQIWEDLCRTPEEVPSPAWHADVLQDREKRVQEGSTHFLDWAEAKRRIRDSTK